jgi:hypothetical protein
MSLLFLALAGQQILSQLISRAIRFKKVSLSFYKIKPRISVLENTFINLIKRIYRRRLRQQLHSPTSVEDLKVGM